MLPIPSAVAAKPWILVVDDEPAMREMLSALLMPEGLDVVMAADGETALRELEQRPEPLLVLTDVLMRQMDGLTLARKLAAKLKRSKIVVMSGHLTDTSWWPTDLREVAFIAKPFRRADLQVLLREAQLGN